MEEIVNRRKKLAIFFTIYAVIFAVIACIGFNEVSVVAGFDNALVIMGVVFLTLILLIIGYFVGKGFGRFMGIYGIVMGIFGLALPLYVIVLCVLYNEYEKELFGKFLFVALLIVGVMVFSGMLHKVSDDEFDMDRHIKNQQLRGQGGIAGANVYFPYVPDSGMQNPNQPSLSMGYNQYMNLHNQNMNQQQNMYTQNQNVQQNMYMQNQQQNMYVQQNANTQNSSINQQ